MFVAEFGRLRTAVLVHRIDPFRQNNATDPVNAALNYGYAFLEGECRRAINAVGLEPSVGFLHGVSDYQTKQSLVYDLQEPFRWLIDLTVVQAFESGSLDVPSFYFTGDDYRYRFDVEAKRRFVGLLREQFNSGVCYKGKIMKWSTIIELKTAELGRFLIGRSREIDLTQPCLNLKRYANLDVRKQVLGLNQQKAEELGIARSTLHYLRKHAKNHRPFRIYRTVKEKLEISG
jgi:CRISPR-associated protein Cas1